MKVVTLLLVPLLAACSGSGPAKKTRPPPLVAVARVEARDVPVEVKAPVDLRPVVQADIGSKTLGYLDAVLVDRGDRVKKGQLLALVRPSDLPDQLTAARGTLAQAQAQLALARSTYQRDAELAPKGIVSTHDLEQSKSTLDAAEATAAASQAQLGGVATKLGETRIVAPFDGWVANRRLDPGALVGATGQNGTILTVVRIDTLKAFVSVGERDAAGVAMDQLAHVEIDALPGSSFQGKVVRVAPEFDPLSRTLQAEIQLPNPGDLRPGMYGRGAIVLSVHHGVPVAPVEAVQISGGNTYVFTVDGDTVHRKPVRTGVDGGEWLEIASGIGTGETVVVAGLDGLSDGAHVRVAQSAPAEGGKPAAPTEKRD